MAVEEMFTSLPTVGSAQLTDIICAVQGYTSPASLGLSVQESLQQVYNLFQSNVVLYYAGNPNGNLAGMTYQFCWDTTDGALYICTTSGTSSTAVWTAITSGSGAFFWNFITASSATMVAQNGYITSNVGLVTLTLPTTATVGTEIRVIGQASGGWSIIQNASQYIIVGSSSSTPTTGSVSSTNGFDSINLVCTQLNTIWTASGAPQGNLTIV